jgi:hypothetical protein
MASALPVPLAEACSNGVPGATDESFQKFFPLRVILSLYLHIPNGFVLHEEESIVKIILILEVMSRKMLPGIRKIVEENIIM